MAHCSVCRGPHKVGSHKKRRKAPARKRVASPKYWGPGAVAEYGPETKTRYAVVMYRKDGYRLGNASGIYPTRSEAEEDRAYLIEQDRKIGHGIDPSQYRVEVYRPA